MAIRLRATRLGDINQLPVAKQLLELIHHHQQIHVLCQGCLLHDVDQPPLAHAQGGVDDVQQRQTPRFEIAEQHPVFGKGLGHRGQRVVAGPELGHAPAGAGAGHSSLVQGRPQAAVHQGGFAAPRGAHHRQESPLGKFVDQGIYLMFPAEEQMLLLFPEGPQTRKWIGDRRGRCGIHATTPWLLMACRNSSMESPSNPVSPLIREASSIAIMSCLSSVSGSAR